MAIGDGTGITGTIDKDNSSTKAKYKLSNMSLQVQVLGLATSVLDQLVESRIASVGYLSLPFKNYYTYSSQMANSTMRFSANSASLDKLWITYRATSHATSGGVHAVIGHKLFGGLTNIGSAILNGAVSGAKVITFDLPVGRVTTATGLRKGDFVRGYAGTANACLSRIASVDSATQVTVEDNMTLGDNTGIDFMREMGVSSFDAGGTLGSNSEKYISKFFRFRDPTAAADTTPSTYSLQVNGATLPAYKLGVNEFYEISKQSAESYKIDKEMTLSQYKDSYFVQCFAFNLPGSDITRMASGLDTRAVSAQMGLELAGVDDSQIDIFVETTAELRVGSGRSIEVIA